MYTFLINWSYVKAPKYFTKLDITQKLQLPAFTYLNKWIDKSLNFYGYTLLAIKFPKLLILIYKNNKTPFALSYQYKQILRNKKTANK